MGGHRNTLAFLSPTTHESTPLAQIQAFRALLRHTHISQAWLPAVRPPKSPAHVLGSPMFWTEGAPMGASLSKALTSFLPPIRLSLNDSIALIMSFIFPFFCLLSSFRCWRGYEKYSPYLSTH
uniref:Uncharacterized protein n=1 Tax=Hemiselmis andersenii TaxID=464988 RepID=A0A7S1MWF9_HEMAN